MFSCLVFSCFLLLMLFLMGQEIRQCIWHEARLTVSAHGPRVPHSPGMSNDPYLPRQWPTKHITTGHTQRLRSGVGGDPWLRVLKAKHRLSSKEPLSLHCPGPHYVICHSPSAAVTAASGAHRNRRSTGESVDTLGTIHQRHIGSKSRPTQEWDLAQMLQEKILPKENLEGEGSIRYELVRDSSPGVTHNQSHQVGLLGASP